MKMPSDISEQLSGMAGFDNASFVYNHDQIAVSNSSQAMSDRYNRGIPNTRGVSNGPLD
jgi:hypothetical protein